ncbi:hypothetical protein [Streptomyces ginkgonis]|uniref:hypothetical protein n=1 Tax=Streptomyces ginkgonis TaxID=1812259 RepID=UPI002176AF69|nr:hypothetical protein [Streptomyces ginkgonis]
MLSTNAARNVVGEAATRVQRLAIAAAPRTRKSNWNKIAKNMTVALRKDEGGWYANLVIEGDRRVRHALLLERGWRDPRGRRHPGRRFLKTALEKARRP